MAAPKPVQQAIWFIALWVGGVACVTVVGLAIRAVLMPS